MNYLSLFDGMSCFQIALKELGYPIGKYYAAEVDKFAIKQTQHVFSDTIQLGDVRDVDVSTLPKIDILCGGSPCTDLSFAGKQSGLIMDTFDQYMELRNEYLETRDEQLYFHNGKFQQSILFWEYLRILKDFRKVNPDVKFLLENVRMTKKNQLKFNRNLGLGPSAINSNLVSAQNRYRLYFTDIRTKKEGLFSELCTDIPQPKDRGIFLKDILQPESEVDEKYYLSNTALTRAMRKDYSKPKVNPDKTGTLSTKNNSGQCCFDSGTTLIGLDINKKAPTQRSSTGRCLTNKHNYQIIPVVNDKGNLRQTEKANCIDANYHKGMDNHSQRTAICVSQIGRRIDENGTRKDYNKAIPAIQRLEPAPENKTNCLTSVAKDNLIMTKNYVQWDTSGKGHKSQTDRAYYEGGKHGTLASHNGGSKNCVLLSDYKLRRLTPIECSRLQTIPSWYEWIVSDSQIYKLLGNGFTVEAIKHILLYYKPEK